MTDTQPQPIHREWCTQPDGSNLYRFEDSGLVLVRCRSCRSELIDFPTRDRSEST